MVENKMVVANENFDWNAFENELDLYDRSKDEIAGAYDQTLSKVQVGEVVEGTVVDINKREVVVNIGYKSEGIIEKIKKENFNETINRLAKEGKVDEINELIKANRKG